MDRNEDNQTGFDIESGPNTINLEDNDFFKVPSLNNKEASSIEHYCRVCGSEINRQSLILIFGKRGKELLLQKKIFDHLHLEVEKNDNLPQQICVSCISHLNTCQEFLENSQNAAIKLRQLFLQNEVKEEECPITSESNKILSISEQDLPDSNNLGELEVDGSVTNVTDVKKTVKARKNDKQRMSVLCHICGKAFKDMANLHSHKRTHLPEDLKKKFQCSVCIKSFRTNFHLSEHMNMHLGVTPYACSICEKQFHSRALLRQHAQVHLAQADDKNKVACPKCGLLCSRKGNLRAHLRTHSKDRTFDCCLCQRQFPSFSEMLSHRKQHSQEEIKKLLQQDLIKDKDRIITCQLCDKIFTDKRILVTHVERMHNCIDVMKFTCTDCGKVLNSQRSLVYHQRSMHTADRPYRCSYCGEGFMLLKLLKAHETKHTGERPFKCDICGKGFRSRNNLHQHLQKHDGVRKFECNGCGKKFQRKATLEVHNRVHSGEKPFVCDLCGRGFTQKNDLMKHQRTHLEGNSKSRTCEQCMVVFTSKKELLKHREEAHTEGAGVIPLIVTNSLYETHVITEDGQSIVFPTVEGVLGQSSIIISAATEVAEVQ